MSQQTRLAIALGETLRETDAQLIELSTVETAAGRLLARGVRVIDEEMLALALPCHAECLTWYDGHEHCLGEARALLAALDGGV